MIAAVIPTRYHPSELDVLLKVLDEDGVQEIVLESDAYDHAIYRMWNVGVRWARVYGASHVAVLNDDIAMRPGTLSSLADQLDQHPDVGVVYPDVTAEWDASPGGIERTTGTWGAGGMTGFCFMFRADLPVAFDEAFHWWYGDDAFEADVRALGLGVARVRGVPIRHIPGQSAARRDDLGPLIAADQVRWEGRVPA